MSHHGAAHDNLGMFRQAERKFAQWRAYGRDVVAALSCGDVAGNCYYTFDKGYAVGHCLPHGESGGNVVHNSSHGGRKCSGRNPAASHGLDELFLASLWIARAQHLEGDGMAVVDGR